MTTIAQASQAAVVRPVLLVSLDYASGVQRLCTAPFGISAMGQYFDGVGQFGGVEPVRDQPGTGARPLVLSLSGIDPAAIAAALTEDYRGRPAMVWVALLGNDYELLADPLLVFRGQMDTQQIRLGDTGTIAVSLTSRTADWDRPRGLRFTDAAQKARFPGDLGLENVALAETQQITWGR